jgi:Co/Zn/Cd efflux system component
VSTGNNVTREDSMSRHGKLPSAFAMGAVGMAPPAANAASFSLLWACRKGDANVRSAWICARNDVLVNIAVLLAPLGVFGTGNGRPDVVVAAVMAGLAPSSILCREGSREDQHASSTMTDDSRRDALVSIVSRSSC